MGYSGWSNDTYRNISSGYVGKSADQIFSATFKKDMSAVDVTIRESRDSDVHPESLAIGIFLDVTGSMGRIPHNLITGSFGTVMDTLISEGILHPQVMFGAIGDQYSDNTPLQVSQFESGTEELDKWLKSIYIEGNGGGQHMESYPLAWLFFARHTSIDCFEKRGQKGFIFTVGDEGFHPVVDVSAQNRVLGYKEPNDITAEQLFHEVNRMYHVFHIHVNEGSYRNNPDIFNQWRGLLNERFLVLEDQNHVAQLIATTVAIVNGKDIKTVVSRFSNDAATDVSNALMRVVGSDLTTREQGIGKL